MSTPLRIGQAVNPGLPGYQENNPETLQPWGTTYDQRHGQYGEQAEPYAWVMFDEEPTPKPQRPTSDYVEDTPNDALPAGLITDAPNLDQQPVTHAAPWPKGVPQSRAGHDATNSLIERAEIHSSDMGADRAGIFLEGPQQDSWVDFQFTDPGDSIQEPIPKQIAGAQNGFGTRDRRMGLARQNSYGFDSAHRSRRWANGHVPGNFDMLKPGSRPFVYIPPRGGFTPTGPDSPFGGQNPQEAWSPNQSVLTDLPQSYEPPPQPPVNTSPLPENVVPIDWY